MRDSHRYTFVCATDHPTFSPIKGTSMSIERLREGPRMSQAVIHGGIVHLAGQVAAGESVTIQAKAIFAAIETLLGEAGTDKSRILTATIWLADMADFGEMNIVWDAWIGGENAPARATGEVRLASADYRIEVIIVAALP